MTATIEEKAIDKKTKEALERKRQQQQYAATAGSASQMSAAEARAAEAEWAREIGGTQVKARRVIRTERLGDIFEELGKKYVKIWDNTPKELLQKTKEDGIKRIAQPIFAAISKVIGEYLKQEGDDKNKDYLLLRDMENYWAGLNSKGKLPRFLRSRYNNQSIGLQIAHLSKIERELLKSLKEKVKQN